MRRKWKGGYSRKSVLTGITSFLIVLFTMPLGHALMIFMEHVLSSTALHYAAFTMGAVGLVMVIIGVFAKGDTRQTIMGIIRRTTLLDRMGRVYLRILCTSLWSATIAERCRWSRDKTGIFNHAFLLRLLGDVYADLHFQYKKRMRLLYLSSKSLFP